MRMLRRFPFSRSAEVYFLSFSFLFFSEDKDEKKKGREIIKKKRKEKRNKQTNKQTTATTSPSLGPSIKKKKTTDAIFFGFALLWVLFRLKWKVDGAGRRRIDRPVVLSTELHQRTNCYRVFTGFPTKKLPSLIWAELNFLFFSSRFSWSLQVGFLYHYSVFISVQP